MMLKKVVIIDIFCISGFFLLRIVAGGQIADVEISHWIIFMTALLALFLGVVKRRQEIVILQNQATAHRQVLTQYSAGFIDQIVVVIASSIVVAYMLYVVDIRTVGFFGTTRLIISIPFVYYGVFRYLYIVHKLDNDGDPIKILLSDKPLQINLFLWSLICIAVIYGGQLKG